MIIHSRLLGSLTVTDEEVYSFPLGLFGFPECRSFAMVRAERDGFYWLQSVDLEALAFILVDPFVYFDGYSVDVPTPDLRDLEIADAAELAIFAIVTLPRTPAESPTANLHGPLAFNMRLRRGKQLALQDEEYGVRCTFDLDAPSVVE